jgi:hypothetical protein
MGKEMALQALYDIGNVILEPTPTFGRLKEKTSPWIPLLALILLTLGVTYWWISTADLAWLRDHMIAGQAAAKPEARAAMEKIITPSMMLWSSAAGAVLGTPAIFALTAWYYLMAAKVMGSPIGYGKWFSFVAWVSVPRLLVIPLMAFQIATSHGRLAPEDLNMVSLNYLLLHLPGTSPWATLAGNLDLATFWSAGLAAVGLKAWTGRSMGTCVFVAVLPYLIVYGLWAAKIAMVG